MGNFIFKKNFVFVESFGNISTFTFLPYSTFIPRREDNCVFFFFFMVIWLVGIIQRENEKSNDKDGSQLLK